MYERLAERFLEPARAALGEASWKRAHRAGAALTFDEAMAVALDDGLADVLASTSQARAARQPPGA